MKILLTGSSGLLGSEFKKILSRDNHIELLAPSHSELELLEEKKTLDYLKKHQPDLLIHCVAYTQVDQAEDRPRDCEAINVDILRTLLQNEIPLIHFSSDYVFDGRKAEGYQEDDPTSPLSVYGASKVKAEKLLQEYSKSWWNIRTSWLFGGEKSNFIDKILTKVGGHKSIQVVDDQVGRPTYAKDLAEFVVDNFVRRKDSRTRGMTEDCSLLIDYCSLPSGHYHLQNSGNPVSWADLAEFVVKEKGLPCSIERVSSEVHNSPALRPTFSILKNTKLKSRLRDWQEAVTEYLEI